jgi:hypothetical protein
MTHIIGRFGFICMVLLMSCKPAPESELREFEFSNNICQDITNAVNTRWNEATGVTKAQYHANLITAETEIIDYELPRYRARLKDMESGTGPANGPGGSDIPLDGATQKTTSEPVQAQQPSFDTTNQGIQGSQGDQGGFNLQQGVGSSVDLAKAVCPGCSIDVVRQKLATLEGNKLKITSCQGPQVAAASTTGLPSSGLPADQSDQTDLGVGAAAAPSTEGVAATPEEEKKRQADIAAIKNIIVGATQPKELCKWWGTVAGGSGASRDRCKRDSIAAFCGAALKAAINGTTSAATGGSLEKVETEVLNTIPGAIKTAMVGCIQQMAYDTVKDALRNAGTRQFLPDATKKLARDAIDSDGLSSKAKADKINSLKKDIALALCKAGGKLVANQITDEPQINYDNPCAAILQRTKSRAKACALTASSACKIAAGDIDVKNFLPEGAIDDKPLAELSAEVGNTVASIACEAGSKASKFACAAISESAAQIRKAITTGNNDWAHCVGTDQMGACGGTVYAEYMLGIKADDMKQPIRTAKPVPSKPEYSQRDICWCWYSCYQDDWGSNTELHKSNYYTVISAGGAGERECTKQDGRWNWTGNKSKAGYSMYWKKRSCEIVKARFKTSATGDSDGFKHMEVYYSGRWIGKNMSNHSGSCPSGL